MHIGIYIRIYIYIYIYLYTCTDTDTDTHIYIYIYIYIYVDVWLKTKDQGQIDKEIALGSALKRFRSYLLVLIRVNIGIVRLCLL